MSSLGQSASFGNYTYTNVGSTSVVENGITTTTASYGWVGTNGAGLQDAAFRGGNSEQVTRFFNLSYRQLSAEAKKRGIPETWMVGLGAFESGWLDDHNVRLNNPLGLTEGGGNNIKFRSIDSAVDLFDSLYGRQIEGARSPQDFARRLEGVLDGVKMDGWNKYNSVNPVWEQRLIGVINSVGARLVDRI